MNSEIFRVGQTYSFMGYDWTACELINKGKTLVIQSHGVTHGEWPGFVMPQFGNGNYYADSIDGQDISAYDNTTMRGLVPSTVAAARGMSTRMAASPTTIRATTMWSRPLLISTYPKLRLLKIKLSK